MNEKEFDELKKELLPKELQEHFAKNKQVIDNNVAKFEELENGLSNLEATEEGKAIIGFMLDFAKEQLRSSNIALEHNEMLYVASYFLKQKIDKIENSSGNQGIKIDGLLKYDNALKFIDDYIKRSSEDREIG
ncbi:MAG TPA: hypothetical protein VLD38_08020 [Nitrosopumilaceae archaeon]|nr:hypothetical protein [Nitrosopumilaceae archaeon]